MTHQSEGVEAPGLLGRARRSLLAGRGWRGPRLRDLAVLRRWSGAQWLARIPIAVGPVVAMLATGGAGEWPPVWLLAIVGGLGLYFAARPESSVGIGVLALVVAWWGLGLRDGLTPWAILAAAALLSSHLAALVAAYGPDEAPLPAPLLRRWLWRGACVLYPAPLVLFVVLGLRDQPAPPGLWLFGLLAALAAIAGGGFALSQVGAEVGVEVDAE